MTDEQFNWLMTLSQARSKDEVFKVMRENPDFDSVTDKRLKEILDKTIT